MSESALFAFQRPRAGRPLAVALSSAIGGIVLLAPFAVSSAC